MNNSNNFNFEKEMTYNNKHIKLVENNNKDKYDFRKYISECFNINISKLDEVHNLGFVYDVFKEFGPDTQTWYHETFYKYLKSEKGQNMQKMYDDLIKDIILPYLNF